MDKARSKLKFDRKMRISQVESISMRIQAKSVALKKDTGANAFEASTDIVKFLRALGLCRDATNNQGIVIAKNIRLRCAVLSLMWITFASLSIGFRYKFMPWNKDIWKLEVCYDFINFIIRQLILAVAIWGSVSKRDVIVIRYYADLTRLDEVLNIRNTAHYSQERNILNKRFFSLVIYYSIKIVCQAAIWLKVFGFMHFYLYINDYLANIIQWINHFHYFVLLCMFRSRLVYLNERLEADLKNSGVQVDRNKDRYAEVVKKYKSCYMLLHTQHKIINESHGLKLALGMVCLVFSVVHFGYAVFITANKNYWGLSAGFIDSALELMLFFALVLYIAGIRRLLGSLLDRLEQLLCQNTLSEREQRSVLGLVELMQRQPLRFTACDFFTLDMPLLCSLLNFIATYIIILLQIKNKSG